MLVTGREASRLRFPAPVVGRSVQEVTELRGVLFDFGGTLFAHATLADTIRRAAGGLGAVRPLAWAEALADRIQSAAHDPDELRHPRDLSAAVWKERWHLLYGLADDEVEGLGAAVYAAMHDPREWRPYAGSLATLHHLHLAGVPVAVVSNTGWNVRTVFAEYDAHRLVTSFQLSYEVGSVKPAPQIFLAACAALGTEPARTLMVGDDPVADAGAVRAGLRTLLLPALAPGAANGVEAVLRIVDADSATIRAR